MPDGYDSHVDYMVRVKNDADARSNEVRVTPIRAFAKFVKTREIEVINFSASSTMDLAGAIQAEPSILKPLMAFCNVAEHKPESINRRRHVASSPATARW